MTSWSSNIHKALSSSSTWKASLFMPSSLFLSNDGNDSSARSTTTPSSSDAVSSQQEPKKMTLIDLNNHMAIDGAHSMSRSSNTHNAAEGNVCGYNAATTSTSINTTLSSSLSPFTSTRNSSANQVDILEFLNPPPELNTNIKMLWLCNDYPSNTCFVFEGYKSIESKDALVKQLKMKARYHGTSLVTGKSFRSKINSSNQYSLLLKCEHFGTYMGNNTRTNFTESSFSSECNNSDTNMQLDGTKITVAHESSSISGRSRCATHKRSFCNTSGTDNNPPKSKRNKTQTRKCNCNFSFWIVHDEKCNQWFLKKRTQIKSLSPLEVKQMNYHNNHIKLVHTTRFHDKAELSKECIDAIHGYFEKGISIPQIIQVIESSFNYNLTYDMLYNMREICIDELLNKCGNEPYGSSIDKLIRLFSKTNNVSFIYIIHNFQSGFVTRRQTNSEKINASQRIQNNLLSNNNKFTASIKNWRSSLKLQNNTNDILVAFGWAHDEELRNAEMFPEFLGIDVTFGVNKERRELMVVAGIDGHKKTFTIKLLCSDNVSMVVVGLRKESGHLMKGKE